MSVATVRAFERRRRSNADAPRSTVVTSVTTETITYTSRDGHADCVAIVTLPTNAEQVPLVLLQHGYSENATAIPAATAEGFALRGFGAVQFGLRGRDGAQGANDACGRELFDLIEGVAAVRAHFDKAVSQSRCGIVGYSGGGAVAIACLAKCPDLCSFYVDHFGITDFGVFPGWHGTNPGYQGIIEAAVGGSPSSLPSDYAARRTIESALRNLKLAPPHVRLHIGHSPNDDTVSVRHSDYLYQRAVELGLASRVNYTRDASIVHGYPDTVPALTTLEETYWRKMFNAEPWRMPLKGETVVGGFWECHDLGVYLGDAAAADPDEVAYCRGRARIRWDGPQLEVTPLTGAMSVRYRRGSLSATNANVTATTTLIAA